MTSTRDDERPAAPAPPDPGDVSAFPSLRGLRWWAVTLLALALTVGGVAADILRAGALGFVFLAAYPAGCILGALLAQRRDLFVPMVQPPLLLAVSVPVAVVATGTLPASGGLVSAALAVGAPLINGFPAMAATTLVCVGIGILRSRLQPWTRPEVGSPEPRREPVRSGPAGTSGGRGGVADREQIERRREQERARADRERIDRERADRDRADRERIDRERAERERAERARRERERAERTRRDRDRDGGARGGRGKGRPDDDRTTPRPAPGGRGRPRDDRPRDDRPTEPEDRRSREDRMREERLREERRDRPGRPRGVQPLRERRPDDPPAR